jgi:GNAT superfamily N-acetyltransferase
MRRRVDVRPGIEVGPTRPDNLDGLVDLCLAARRESWVVPQVRVPDPAAVAAQIGVLAGMPGAAVLAAVFDGAVVGVLLGRVVGPNPFTDDVSFVVEMVYVDPRHRRRGVGHALMLAALESAATADAEYVYAVAVPGARGMHRFFVRLGFTPVGAHRVTTTAALQRRLVAESGGRRAATRGIDEVIARRRRTRGHDGAPGLRPVVHE